MPARDRPVSAAASTPDLSTRLTGEILDLIRREDLHAGDRLPSVRALAARFGVATPTLREALRRLQATGAVDIRHGSGTYVRHGRGRLVLASPVPQGLGIDSLLHLLDARTVVEPGLAAMAAERATAADLARLEDVLLDAERSFFPNDGRSARANEAFHFAVARASGNPILAETDEALMDLYAVAYAAAFPHARTRSRELHDHAAILAAIAGRNAQRARQLAHRHLEDAGADIALLLAEMGGDAAEQRTALGSGQ
ncbi:MAG: hypothetical protein AVDCRST_MAG49-3309 [uncultured Thermomicrobiales bacterium]|uniref:HTH gntR-type domain-containing protein n=1 Tax=uncultured Thermomicrobiales bacterium TaxID=1645740 RepID=A0A6J4V4H4_9BACT|nr:MAG: hypothetical protein AVDCRST_MAG49-3309 [uncultured Thermomicrobiales bacterium]